jgi:23S rRNA pseudouridine1911/1915/1917 synthase
MAVVRSGKQSITEYRLLRAAETRAGHVELRLRTGRTHQIRVHLADLGNPIIGDRLYGRRRPGVPEAAQKMVENMDRIALHARHLTFDHPITGERLTFVAEPPQLFAQLLAAMRS